MKNFRNNLTESFKKLSSKKKKKKKKKHISVAISRMTMQNFFRIVAHEYEICMKN